MTLGLSARSLTLLVASTFPAKSQKVSIWSRARRIWPSRSRASGQSVALARMALRSRSSARLWCFYGGGGKVGKVSGKTEGAIEPKLEPHADEIAAMLGHKAGLSVEMGQASLMEPAMSLLGAIAVRYPHLGLMAIHRVAHNLGCAREVSGMDNGFSGAEHPLVGIA